MSHPLIHPSAAEGFQASADAYDRGRPSYPADAIDFIARKFKFSPGKIIVDLGAGTGKLTQQLLPYGPRLMAIEPIAGMRQKFSQRLPQVPILEGSAEAMPIPSQSVDIVLVGQAFHWFDGASALSEIARVLKPGGRLGLLWNVRDESVAWVSQLTRIIDIYEAGTPRYRSGKWKAAFEAQQSLTIPEMTRFKLSHFGTVQTVIDRMASISFIAALPEPVRAQVLEQVRSLLRDFPETFEIPYRTEVYLSRKIQP